MELENIILSEVSQAQKAKIYYFLSFFGKQTREQIKALPVLHKFFAIKLYSHPLLTMVHFVFMFILF
jgi:hypothetical protein